MIKRGREDYRDEEQERQDVCGDPDCWCADNVRGAPALLDELNPQGEV